MDDEPSQALKAGEIKKISAALGEHLVTAVSADGKDRWKAVVDLDKPVQRVVLIELVKVRAARQVAERQLIQLQQEITAKEQQTEEAKNSAQALAGQQDEVRKQRQEIEDQIDELSKEARREEAAAQDDDASAREGQVLAGTSAAQGTGLGNLTATLDNLASSKAVDSAAKHRAKARELESDVADLNRKLERLGAGLTASAGRVDGAPLTPATSTPTVETTSDSSGQALVVPQAAAPAARKEQVKFFTVVLGRECSGVLSIGNGRITFESGNGKHSFDVPLRYVQEAKVSRGWAEFQVEGDRVYDFRLSDGRAAGVLTTAIKEAKGD